MTREEAKDYIREWCPYDRQEEIIKALEQEPCEDCISRQKVLDKIKEVCFSKEQEWVDFRISQGSNGQRDLIIKFIESLPSIQPKPKTAKWQRVMDGAWFYEKCTACNTVHDVKSNYCPNCGAKMEGSEDGKSI